MYRSVSLNGWRGDVPLAVLASLCATPSPVPLLEEVTLEWRHPASAGALPVMLEPYSLPRVRSLSISAVGLTEEQMSMIFRTTGGLLRDLRLLWSWDAGSYPHAQFLTAIGRVQDDDDHPWRDSVRHLVLPDGSWEDSDSGEWVQVMKAALLALSGLKELSIAVHYGVFAVGVIEAREAGGLGRLKTVRFSPWMDDWAALLVAAWLKRECCQIPNDKVPGGGKEDSQQRGLATFSLRNFKARGTVVTEYIQGMGLPMLERKI